MIDFDAVPFRLMRFKYGVPIMLLLLTEGPMYKNLIRKTLGAEDPPVTHAIAFMIECGFVIEHHNPNGCRIKSRYSLTSKGEQYAHVIKTAVNQLIQFS